METMSLSHVNTITFKVSIDSSPIMTFDSGSVLLVLKMWNTSVLSRNPSLMSVTLCFLMSSTSNFDSYKWQSLVF